VIEALGRLLCSFITANMVEGTENTFSWLKKPPALPFAVFHHQLQDNGIIFALWLGTLP
jgi:hypothetical protein